MQRTEIRPRILACSVAALLASTMLVSADDKTWTGAADGNWTTGGNWSPSALLGDGTDGVILNAASTANLTQTLGQTWILTNLVVADVGGPVTINPGDLLVISNRSTMKGRLDMSAATADLNVYASLAISNQNPGILVGAGRTLTVSNVLALVSGVQGPGTVRVVGKAIAFTDIKGGATLLVDGGGITNVSGVTPLGLGALSGETVQVVLTNNGKVQLGTSATKIAIGAKPGSGISILRVESGLLQINGSGGSAGNSIAVGDAAGCSGELDINGGAVNINHQNKNNDNWEGYLNVPGGDGTGTGVVNLNGGKLTAARIKTTSYGPGTFNFNGGTLAANWSAGDTWFSGLSSVYVQAGGAIIDTANYTVTINQSLEAGSGNGGLTKLGTGTLTLSGNPTYTGPTLVNAGTLVLSNSYYATSINLGDVTIADNAGLGVNLTGQGTSTSLSVANLTLGSSGSVNLLFNYGTLYGNPSNPALEVSGALNLNAAGIAITIQGSGFAAGSFPLFHYSGTPLANLDQFTLHLPPGLTAAKLVNNTANHTIDLDITVAVPVQLLTWYGGYGPDWDFTTYNWNYGANVYQEHENIGDIVTFDSTGAGPTINLTSKLSPYSVTVDSAMDYAFTGSGKLTGAGSLIKRNAGVLTIATTNNYTGGTFITNGPVQLGTDSALGTGPVTLAGGRICSDSTEPRTLPNPLVFAMQQPSLGDSVNNGSLTLAGPLDINSPSVWRSLTANSDVIISGGSTNGALQKQGPATLVLLNCTNYWGTQNALVFNGTFAMTNAYLSTFSSMRPECNVPNGLSRLIVGPGSVWENPGGAGDIRVAGGNGGGSTTATNVWDVLGIVRCSNPTNTDNGNLLFDNNRNAFVNLYAGALVSARSVQFTGTGTGYNELNFDGGTLSATPASPTGIFMDGLSGCFIRGGGAVMDSTNASITIAQALLDGGGNGGLTKRGTGSLTLTGANTYTGPTAVDAGALILGPNHAAPGAVTVAPGAALGFLSDAAGSTAHVSGATVNGKVSVAFSNQAGVPTAAAGSVNTLTLNGTVAVDVTSLPDGLTGGETIPLIHYDTLSGAVTTGQLPNGVSGTILDDTGTHTIKLVTTMVTPVQISGYSLSGGNFVLSGSGGPTGGGQSYYVLSSTNLATSVWEPVLTNLFNSDGTFSATLPVTAGEPQRFYRLQLP